MYPHPFLRGSAAYTGGRAIDHSLLRRLSTKMGVGEENKPTARFHKYKEKTWDFTCSERRLMIRVYLRGEVLLPTEETGVFLL